MLLTTLKPVLLDIVAYLEELRQTLVSEYEALSKADSAAMQQAAITKHRLTDILENLETERLKILKSAGLKLEKTGLMSYLNRHNQDSEGDELAYLWQRVKTLTHDCERLNQINGLIIEKQRRRTESALNLLQGQQNPSSLYSAEGTKVTSRTSTNLGKA